jgi:hypothetical protein
MVPINSPRFPCGNCRLPVWGTCMRVRRCFFLSVCRVNLMRRRGRRCAIHSAKIFVTDSQAMTLSGSQRQSSRLTTARQQTPGCKKIVTSFAHRNIGEIVAQWPNFSSHCSSFWLGALTRTSVSRSNSSRPVEFIVTGQRLPALVQLPFGALSLQNAPASRGTSAATHRAGPDKLGA